MLLNLSIMIKNMGGRETSDLLGATGLMNADCPAHDHAVCDQRSQQTCSGAPSVHWSPCCWLHAVAMRQVVDVPHVGPLRDL